MRVSDEAMGFATGTRCRTSDQRRREETDRSRSKGTLRPKSFLAVEADEIGGPESRGWKASFTCPSRWRSGWKASGETSVLNLPQDLGVDDCGRWRWPLPGMTVRAGGEVIVGGRWAFRTKLSTVLHKRIEGMRARIDLMPRPSLSLGMPFYIDGSTLEVEATTGGVEVEGLGPAVRLTLRKRNNLVVQTSLGIRGVRIAFMKSNPGRESILDVGASVTTADGDETSKGKSWSCPRIEGLVANVYGKGLLPSWEIFNDSSTHNSHGIPKVIALVAGHCIDPGYDTGAPGEREQSKRIADMSSRMLKANGWKILRPDRDARHLTWLEYNDWINQRTREGIPVIEIHGQGKCNGVQGKLTGVIGQRLSLLNKELAKTFGYFPTNWRRLRVARNGGTVLEAFNTDRLKRMSHGERIKAAHNLAAIIAGAVVQAESASTSTADNAVYNGCSLTGCPRE